jgi:trimeric autotransporter adhesin
LPIITGTTGQDTISGTEGDDVLVGDPGYRNKFTLLSISSNGTQANDIVYSAKYSQDGTKLLFQTKASNLVNDDTNSSSDIFVKDLLTGEVTCISKNLGGVIGNNTSSDPTFSPDGTKVAFASQATNLLNSDNNGVSDIFIKDLISGAVTRVSTNLSGTPANNYSYAPVFSPDGTKLLFTSDASNLVSGDTNRWRDVFVKDLSTGVVTRVSTGSTGTQANASNDGGFFSTDGTKVFLSSAASNILTGVTNGYVKLLMKDILTGTVSAVASTSNGIPGNGYSLGPVYSADGSKVAFTSNSSNLVIGDLNPYLNLYVKNTLTGEIIKVATDVQGGMDGKAEYVLSPDGNNIAFITRQFRQGNFEPGANYTVVQNLETGALTTIMSACDFLEGFSPDGKSLLFGSFNSLVAADTNASLDLYSVSLEDALLPKGDQFSGGDGIDTVTYVNARDGVTVDLRDVTGFANLGVAHGDTYNSVERFVLTNNGDVFVGSGMADVVYGLSGRDSLSGGLGDDTLRGGVANDNLNGDDANDNLFGDGGNDTLNGGLGNDLLVGGTEDDKLYGGADEDTLFGQDGFDFLSGGAGNDILRGGDLGDTLNGDNGNDKLLGNNFSDTLDGGSGEDFLYGGSDDDLLFGGSDRDSLYGQDGSDVLYGDSGDDVLNGGTGFDRVIGGSGNDTLRGGADADDFIFSGLEIGNDKIWDFTLGSDKIVLLDVNASAFTLSQSGNSAILTITATGTTIRVMGVSDIAELSQDIFLA